MILLQFLSLLIPVIFLSSVIFIIGLFLIFFTNTIRLLIQVSIRVSKDIAQFLPFRFTQKYNIAISTKKRNNNYSKLLYALFIIASLHNTTNVLLILYFKKIIFGKE